MLGRECEDPCASLRLAGGGRADRKNARRDVHFSPAGRCVQSIEKGSLKMLECRGSFRALGLAVGLALAFSTAAGAGTLDDLKKNGTIRLGVRTDAKPFSYSDTDGSAKGYVVDICRAVVEKLKTAYGMPDLKTEYVKFTTETRFDDVQQG